MAAENYKFLATNTWTDLGISGKDVHIRTDNQVRPVWVCIQATAPTDDYIGREISNKTDERDVFSVPVGDTIWLRTKFTEDKIPVYVEAKDPVSNSSASADALLQDIVDELVEIKTQPRVEFSREVWIDANGLTFIRTETRDEVTGAITVAYVDAGGNTVSPVAPFLPFASGDRELVKHCYTAIADGAGAGAIGWGAGWGSVLGGFAGAGNQYSIGDKIIRINVIDPITGATFQAFWFNETTGLYIAEPLQADLEICKDGGQIIETPQVWSDPFAVEFQVYSREVTSYDAGYTTTAIEFSTDGINWAATVPPTLPAFVSTPVNFVRLGYLLNTPADDVATESKQDAQISIAQAQADAIGSQTDLSVQNGNDGTVIALLKGISKSLYALFDRFVSKQIRIDSFQYTGTGAVSIPANCTKIEIYIPDGAVVAVDGVAIPPQIETATISDDHGRELTIGSIEITTAGASPVFVLTYSF